MASDGTALILPDRATNSLNQTLQVLGSFRAAGGSFEEPLDVSGLQDGPQDGFESAAAVAPGGRALAVWTAADHSGTPNAPVHVSEFGHTPATFSAISAPATASVGQRVEFSAAATDALSGALTIAWDLGDGSQAAGGAVSHVFGTPGAKAVRVTVTDAAGNSTSQTRVIAVRGAAPVVDRTPPSITRLAVTPGRFRVGSRATAALAAAHRGKRARVGGTLRMTLSEQPTVAIAIRHGRAARGTLVRASVRPGAVSIAFSGRIGGTALAPGTYAATVTAIDAAGNRSAPRTAKFTIVKRQSASRGSADVRHDVAGE